MIMIEYHSNEQPIGGFLLHKFPGKYKEGSLPDNKTWFHLLVHTQLVVPGRDRRSKVENSFVFSECVHWVTVPVCFGRTHAETQAPEGVAATRRSLYAIHRVLDLDTLLDRELQSAHVLKQNRLEPGRFNRLVGEGVLRCLPGMFGARRGHLDRHKRA